MKQGSVIVDLAAATGGNCESTKLGEEVEIKGTKVIGPKNLSSDMAFDASIVYSKNLLGLLEIIIKKNKINLNFDDEIIDTMMVYQDGKSRIEE